MSQAAPQSIPRGVPTMLHAAALRPRSKLRAGTSTGQKLDITGQNWAKLDKNWTNGSGPESPQLEKTGLKLNKTQQMANWTKTGQLDQRRKTFVQIERPELDKLDKTLRNWTKTGRQLDEAGQKLDENLTELD